MLERLKGRLKDFSLKEFAKKYKYTIICVIYFAIIVFLQTGRIKNNNILNILTVVCIINILAKTRYTLPLSIFVVFSICVDAYFAFVYNEPISPAMAASIMETNSNEARQMLWGAILPAIVIIIFTCFIYIQTWRELKRSLMKRWFSVAVIVLFLGIIMPSYIYSRARKDITGEFGVTAGVFYYVQQYSNNRMSLVFGNWIPFLEYAYEKQQEKKYASYERKKPENIELIQTDSLPQKLFIIVGESSSRNHYSLYGYKRPTTPYLDSLNTHPSTLIHINGISAAPITRDAVPLALSFATPKNRVLFYSQYNIIDMAKQAGYQTLWISNQEVTRVGENAVSQLASVADIRIFNTKSDNNKTDLALISIVKKTLVPSKKQCFFIHMDGSHALYTERSDNQDAQYIKGKTVIDEYDRTIHHTDRFIRQLDQICKANTPSILYFFSDHGEDVGDIHGHGLHYGGKTQYEVPIFAINHSALPIYSIMDKYVNKATSLMNTSNNIYILSEFMGYKIDRQLVNMAVETGNYVFHTDSRPRTLQEVEDLKNKK